MAAAFAELPVHVLWRLSAKEVPDEAALAALSLGNNTKVAPPMRCCMHAALYKDAGRTALNESICHGCRL